MNEEQNPLPPNPMVHSDDPAAQMRRISRRGILWSAVALVGTYATYHFIHKQGPLKTAPDTDDGIDAPFREGLQFDDKVTASLYSPSRLSPTYKDSDITEARQNGDEGLNDDFDPAEWKLQLGGLEDPKGKVLTLEDIKAFPKVEYVTEFKCIEGWSFFMKWAGTRFADFYKRYPPAHESDYVALETPDAGYYVSIDMPAALHPQTLLCYEMNGQPLALEHGAPLRLIIPHKYGIKNIKRIGKITYVFKPPKDFWAEQGYDYYAGL